MTEQEDSARALIREIFLRWLSTDRIERQPPTESELARLLGIQTATLSLWKEEREFMNEIAKRVRMKYSDRLPSLIANLYSCAEKGDIGAINLFLHSFDTNLTEPAPSVAEMLNSEVLKVPSWAEHQHIDKLNEADVGAQDGNQHDVPTEEEN